MGVLTGFTSTLWRCNCNGTECQKSTRYIKVNRGLRLLFQGPKRRVDGTAYLLKILSIEQNPCQLNDFGRILGHVYAMFIASGRNVDDYITVDLERRGRLRRHGAGDTLCSNGPAS
jgi:hypothetical protein